MGWGDGTIGRMKRVLVVTWALGTATGVLLGLFGVQLVSSRFSTAGVSPLSRPEVLRALQAARTHPGPAEVALSEPSTPDTAVPHDAPCRRRSGQALGRNDVESGPGAPGEHAPSPGGDGRRSRRIGGGGALHDQHRPARHLDDHDHRPAG